jgi:hypothetical protein
MRTVRFNTFETNSSSVHCIVFCDNKTLKDFKKHKNIVKISNNVSYGEYKDYEFISLEDFKKELLKLKGSFIKDKDDFGPRNFYYKERRNGSYDRVVVFDENDNFTGTDKELLLWIKDNLDCLEDILGYVPSFYKEQLIEQVEKDKNKIEIYEYSW